MVFGVEAHQLRLLLFLLLKLQELIFVIWVTQVWQVVLLMVKVVILEHWFLQHILVLMRNYKMTTYKLIKNLDGEIKSVLRDSKDCIPFFLDNTDYQAYLKWVEEGNQPLPADE